MGWGYSLFHTWSHIISLTALTSGVRWPFSGLQVTFPNTVFLGFTVALIISHYHFIISLSPPCLPATFPPFEADPFLGQRASSWSRGLYFYSIIYTSSCLFFFIVASIMVLKDRSMGAGISQGNIRHAPKTRNVVPIKVLNPPRVENHPQTGHWDSIPSRSA
jgi:hypothetical protein